MRKHQKDSKPPKEDPMVTSPVAKSKPQHLVFPTSSLEFITPSNGGSKPKGKDKASTSSFWDDTRAAVLKAHEAISIDNLRP
nr:hypothetical protein CFP56_19088 [Quercus suber]